jgi:hypothetical protein
MIGAESLCVATSSEWLEEESLAASPVAEASPSPEGVELEQPAVAAIERPPTTRIRKSFEAGLSTMFGFIPFPVLRRRIAR